MCVRYSYSTIKFFFRIPEIGEDLPDKNPLLQHDGLPEFNNVTVENCMASIGKQTLEFETGVKRIEEKLRTESSGDLFKDVFEPLEELGAPLDLTWGVSKTLYLGNSSLMPTKCYVAIHDRAKRARACKYNSNVIYEAVKKELSTDKTRSDEETRVLRKFNLEGKLNGLDLVGIKKVQLEENLRKIAFQKSKFKNKIDVATNNFVHKIHDPAVVRGFPVELLKAMSVNPDNYLNGPWSATLQPSIYRQVLEYCPDREIRRNIWQAIVSRGSVSVNPEIETSVHLEEIRYLRRDIARVLGYSSFVEMSMETKMAGSLENIQNMFATLLDYAMPAQQNELKELYDFATQHKFEGARIELWDVPFWKRRQSEALYGYDENKFKEYFPLSSVLEGLFRLSEKLFDIVIKQRNNVPTWHKDVQYYDVFESHTSAPIAGFYLDPYARSDEKLRIFNNSGWMVGIRNRSSITQSKPLAALVFNFQPPSSDRPSLLTYKEVNHLFHKFGQSLQHLLTKAEYSEVSGVSNIEWDAVEACGYVFSHWLRNKHTLNAISSHVVNGEKLPENMIETLLNVNRHMAGLDLSRELYLSALDLELHSSKEFWLAIVKNLWPQYRCFPLDKIDSHPCSFTQIFVEEWAAAYYSHLWSRLIAADIYSAFHEVQGNENEIMQVSKRFRDTFLALGGSCHPSEVFRKFRGRDPSPNALLKSLGLKKKKTVVET